MTLYLRPEARVDIDGTEYGIIAGTITLDSSAVPYGVAEFEVPLLDDTTLEWLDPRDNVRCPLEAGDETEALRPFNLGLRSRSVDNTGKTVSLRLATDEALLMDAAALADDTTPLTIASSLRAVVNHVLGAVIPGASLEAGTDADVTPLWDAINLVPNPSFEAGNGGYTLVTNASAPLLVTTAGFVASGTQSMRYTSTAAGTTLIRVGTALDTMKVTPGRSYSFSFYHRSSTSRSGSIGLTFYNADGLQIADPIVSWTSSSTTMGRHSMSAIAPPGAVSVWPRISTGSNTAGQFHWIDAVMLTEGEYLPVYFDGGLTDTAQYDYAWSGTANLSQSIRTKLVDAPEPDALVWRAGQTAWDFLMPLAAAAGMVLWCDENRDWWLKTPEARTIATTLSVSPDNTRDGTDTLSRDDDDAYVTGVAVIYTWTDRDGISRRRVDAAGTNEKVLTLELDQPYPGPGAAAGMLTRRQGTGRVQDVTSASDWAATPGMTVQITLPGAPETTGRLVSVRFNLDDGFMDIGTSGLVDIIPGSIDALVGSINSLAGTINSL